MNISIRTASRMLVELQAVGLALFAVVISFIGVFDTVIVTATTVLLGLLISLFRLESDFKKSIQTLVSPIFHALIACALLYLFRDWINVMLEQEEFFIDISQQQLIYAWISIILISYLTYRFFGIIMLLVLAIAAAYLLLPNSIGAAGVDWMRAAENLWFGTDGVFGRPVEVVSRVILIFIVFGAVLQRSGAGDILLKMAFSATGRFPGGPAHAAILSSGMFGSLSGSAVANVVSTGVFTIPIIKKVGFSPKFAGAIEAAASTGGQIMPPVMGVVAFLMSDITGIPYLHIILAALIPAIMYYASLFIVVYIEAKKLGIEAIPPAERVKLTKDDWLKSIAFWIPLGVIIAVLVTGRTAQNAGFYALITAFILCLLFFPKFRHPKMWWQAMVDAGKTSAMILVIVSAIGFVIGVVNMTGIGLMFAESVLTIASTNLGLGLVFVMLACIVMGMGVPTGAAYLLIAIVLGPALQNLGISLAAAHLFVIYFGVLSVVTPPVALAAFAAAPIAKADPMATGLEAVRLAIAGFIIPYLFVFHPDILLILDDFSIVGLLWGIVVFALSTWCIATALAGWEGGSLSITQRVFRLLAAILVILPGFVLTISGIIMFLACLIFNRNNIRNLPTVTHNNRPEEVIK